MINWVAAEALRANKLLEKCRDRDRAGIADVEDLRNVIDTISEKLGRINVVLHDRWTNQRAIVNNSWSAGCAAGLEDAIRLLAGEE